MPDKPTPPARPPVLPNPVVTKRPAGPRQQHVVAHTDPKYGIEGQYDEILVFGQKIDALEYCHGKPGWVYAAVSHGQSFAEALKAARS